MKKYILLVAALGLAVSVIRAQDTAALRKFYLAKADSAVLEKVKLDFAIPDIPAFKALGIEPSNILRPSAAKDFSLMFSNLANSGFSAIPKNAAVEVAPALFIQPWYTLQQYRENGGLRFLTKTRVSLGTNQDEKTKVNSVSFGLRSTIFDKGDYRLNKAHESRIYDAMKSIQAEWGKRTQAYKTAMGVRAFAELPQSRQTEITDSIFKVIGRENEIDIDTFIKKSIVAYKKENWNASRMDIAYALLLQSPDSLIDNIKANKHSFWATLALKPGKNNTWAQILLGINNATYAESSKWYNEFTGSFRFYGGTNRFKGLFELQYQNINHPTNARVNNIFAQLGIEANLYKGAWIQFSTGVVNALEGSNRSALRSNLNIALTFPEDFKLF